MKMSRVMMLVAGACFAAGTMMAAQGRGHGPAGRGPQIARGASGGPNVGVGRGATGGGGNQAVTPGNSGGGRGNAGTTPSISGDAGKNPGSAGRGNSGAGRGNDGGPPADVGRGGNAGSGGRGNAGGGTGDQPGENAGRGRGDAARGGGNTDDDQGGPGANRGQGGSRRENGASFVARMNPQLRARLEAMLPSGMTIEQAAEGFRNQGQFIAALQQSHNHDISFVDLKADMTGDNPLSLGEATRKLGLENDED